MECIRSKLRGKTSAPLTTALVDGEYFMLVLLIANPSNSGGSLNVNCASFRNEAVRALELFLAEHGFILVISVGKV